VDSARSLAEDGLAIAREFGNTTYVANHRAVLGFLELSLGRYQEAHEQLGDLPEMAQQMGSGIEGEGRFPFVGDEIEALIGMGELDVAEGLLDQFERRARELGRPPLVTIAGRCRGLLSAARNDLPKALSELEEALAGHARLPMPFDRSRTLLALGEVQRRAKQKRAARETLEAALAIFEELGAKLWAEKARAELARVSGRAPAGGLTPTEQRIAELVAEGGSNKEVAAALFVTVKTVERNLTRIYEKLGLRSRTELASRYATPR
jgi:DNA-binding CsgD family transcriptional regulator